MILQRRIAIDILALTGGFVAALPHILEHRKYSLIARGDDDDDDDADDRKKRMLAKGAIIGIAIGVVAFVVLAVAASACFCLRKIKKKRQKRNDKENNDKEKSNKEEDTQRNLSPVYGGGNIAGGGNLVGATRNVGNRETSSTKDNHKYSTNVSNRNYEMTPAQNMDNNLGVETGTHVGGSQYEMNTARTVVSENQGLSNFRNTIISVSSTDNDDENRHYQASEKYVYGGPSNTPPPSPPPQYTAPEGRTNGNPP